MALDVTLLNTQHYKVLIKGKVEQSRERYSTLCYTSVEQLMKREPLSHPQLRSPTFMRTTNRLLTITPCEMSYYIYN